MSKKTAYEKALDEKYGAGFSDMLKKDRTCPDCKTDEDVETGDCPHCASTVNFCENCERFF